MEKIVANHPLSKSADIIKQNVNTLKSLFPTIVKEGKVDVEELKALLGEEVESNEEYYRFMWAGKSSARQEANKPSTGTLRPVKEESKDWDSTQNIFIEGDNLEVLKLLQKSYANRIKMIYIDPPYNTGKDFVYKDNYKDNLGNYLSITRQADEEGKKFSTNTESDGRYHSNWLNMMYPRLKLARNLLKDNGAIFISIDDKEVQNLRKICDEIFGEENFIADLIWEKRFTRSNDAKLMASVIDHIIFYRKSVELDYLREGRTEKADSIYSNPDDDPKGPWTSVSYISQRTKDQRRNLSYPIENPFTGQMVEHPSNAWKYSKEQTKLFETENKLYWGRNGGNSFPRLKKYLSEVKENGMVPINLWNHKDTGTIDDGTKEVDALIGKDVFDYPKPVSLIQRMIKMAATEDESIVLDFFAGSGTTAHAVMLCNSEDQADRKFVCVQLPEPTEPGSEAFKVGYKYISEITKERVRRAGEKIKSEIKEDLFSEENNVLDVGFRVFKLDSSNINSWDGNVKNFKQTLLSASENIKPDRTEEDVLYEILLKSGLDLAQPIEEKTMAGKKVFNIGLGALFICLANDLTTAVAEGIGKWKQELEPSTCRVIFKDTGFNDVEKTNSIQILKRYGINEVNTI